jgi:hypothetical protein
VAVLWPQYNLLHGTCPSASGGNEKYTKPVAYTPWMQGMHCVPLDIPGTFCFIENMKWSLKSDLKCLHKARTSSIFQESADMWRYCILDIGTTTCVHLMVQRACAGNIYCTHVDFKLHSGTLASNFNIVLMMAVCVTVLGESIVQCHATRGPLLNYNHTVAMLPIPVAARSKAWVWGRSLAGNMGLNPTRGMDVCLLWVLCVVRYRCLWRADHSFRGVLLAACV